MESSIPGAVRIPVPLFGSRVSLPGANEEWDKIGAQTEQLLQNL